MRLSAFIALMIVAVSAAAIDPSDPRVAKLRESKAATTTAAAKTIPVDCTKGESVQSAIEKNAGPLTIEVRGTCNENVKILHHDDVTLRGSSPTTDGIHGVASDPQFPAISVRHSDRVRIENLSVSDGPAGGIGIVYSRPTELQNCSIIGNAATGLTAINSLVQGVELTISANQHGIQSVHGTFLSCLGCHFENNTLWAAQSNWGGALTLWDSVVTGQRGILSLNGGYADIDCLSQVSTYPCSLNVTGNAARAIGNATAALYVAGDFTGQVAAFDRGEIQIVGSRQIASAQPGFGNITNVFDEFATVSAGALEDENGVVQESRIKTMNVGAFSRALLRNETVLDGSIQCNSAGDAWLDDTVIATPGSTVSGCEHGAIP